LQALPENLRRQVILVSSLSSEAQALQRLYPQNEVVVAKGVKNIAEKRHWIMQNIAGKVLFMMDDDMTFFTRCKERDREWVGMWKLRDPQGKTRLVERRYPDVDAKIITAAFAAMDKRISTHHPAMICASNRLHNDKHQDTWGINGRIMYAFGVDREVYKKEKIRFDAVKVREDFHVTLAMLERGHEGHIYYDMVVDTYGDYGVTGGCHDERTTVLSDREAFILQSLHPQFVKVVDRQYGRKEVVIAWKKAFKSKV
jgi:hypothetical protein